MTAETKKIGTEDFFLWILVLVPLFFLPKSVDVFNFPKQWVLVSLAIGALFHNQLSQKSKVNSRLITHKLLFWLLLSLSLLVVASGLLTDTTIVRALFGYPGRANGVLTFLAIFAVIWIGSTMAITSDFFRKLLKRLIFLFAAIGLYSFIQFLSLDPIAWNNSYNRIIGTFGNPNFSGAFLGVAALVTLYASIYSANSVRIYFALLSSILLFLALATESLQAGGIFLICIAVLISVFVYKRFTRWKFKIFLVVLILISVFISYSFLGNGPLGEKLYQYTLNLRLNYWRVGIETAGSFPWLGIGPDSYIEGFRLFRGANFVANYSDQVRSDSAHNVLINFMANFGIPAFIILLFVILIISKKALEVLFRNHESPVIVPMVALIWILMLTQSLFSLEQIGLATFQWCCGALLLNQNFTSQKKTDSFNGKNSKQHQRESILQGLKTELSILIGVFTLIAGWSFIRQSIDLGGTAMTSVSIGVTDSVIDEERKKYGDYVEMEITRALFFTNYLLRAERYELVKEIMKKSLSQDPDAVEALEQLAKLAKFQADYPQELTYRKLIEKKDPYNYTNLFDIAQNLNSQGNLLEAKTYAERVLQLSRNSAINETATAILKS
jgi:O-antigen ligase